MVRQESGKEEIHKQLTGILRYIHNLFQCYAVCCFGLTRNMQFGMKHTRAHITTSTRQYLKHINIVFMPFLALITFCNSTTHIQN